MRPDCPFGQPAGLAPSPRLAAADAVPVADAADPTVAASPATRRVVGGEEYGASGWHQLWFGKGYRDIWTMPVDLPVLDLQKEAGGLSPVRQVGSLETPGLALAGKDGRAYTFRSLIKEPERILPPGWRNTIPAALFRDQMAAGHPGAAPIFSNVARSVGLIYERSRLAVMPDDPALGEFRAAFAGRVGTFDTYPLVGMPVTASVSAAGGDEGTRINFVMG